MRGAGGSGRRSADPVLRLASVVPAVVLTLVPAVVAPVVLPVVRAHVPAAGPALLLPAAAALPPVEQDLRQIPPGGFIAVGVTYRPPPGADARRRDLDEMRRLRFTLVRLAGSRTSGSRLAFIERLLANAPFPDVEGFADDAAVMIPAGVEADEITLRAWSALGRGRRIILFDDWAALGRRPAALSAAAAFAEAVTRNAGLYAPLRPRVTRRGAPPIRVTGDGRSIEVHVLESSSAIVIVAVNTARAARKATITFPPDMPEAIWQNLATGATVHFVTGAEGPAYTRWFGGHEVLVLMINTRVR